VILLKNIIKSSLYGFIVGDALGVPVEFMSRDKLKEHPVSEMLENKSRNTTKGYWSDDTAMTLCTIQSLIEMEFMLIVIAKAKLAHKIKEYVDKPNKKDLLSLIELQQQLESFFEHYNMTSFELGLPEVTKEGTYFEDDGLLDDVICSDCYFKGNCNMLNITEKDCEILSENSKTLTKYMK
jgi:hypothetical protein